MKLDDQKNINFNRIAEAIEYITNHFTAQPHLEDIAQRVNLSPFHFQRLFTEWAGVSPKKFLQYTTVEYAKSILNNPKATLFDAAFETGLSGTGRLHDLFVNIEAMTPGEFKNGGALLTINYSFAPTVFGDILVASTPKGICHISFVDDESLAFSNLRSKFPNAAYKQTVDNIQQNALQIFTQDWSKLQQVKLHLKGSAFQIKVWETLLKVPMGRLTTYGTIAEQIKSPNACRAVGTAIGSNPVAFLIPCHRVIQSTGVLGQYHWGHIRKKAMIGWEGAITDQHAMLISS
jgi:AraC family transcriptional regulator of adaptative response/methylated-DNA-[protein]-cysteine methyltransferase